jgi:hypothetical protein
MTLAEIVIHIQPVFDLDQPSENTWPWIRSPGSHTGLRK